MPQGGIVLETFIFDRGFYLFYMHVYTAHRHRCSWVLEEAVKSAGARALGGCEWPDVGARNWAQIIWKSKKSV